MEFHPDTTRVEYHIVRWVHLKGEERGQWLDTRLGNFPVGPQQLTSDPVITVVSDEAARTAAWALVESLAGTHRVVRRTTTEEALCLATITTRDGRVLRCTRLASMDHQGYHSSPHGEWEWTTAEMHYVETEDEEECGLGHGPGQCSDPSCSHRKEL